MTPLSSPLSVSGRRRRDAEQAHKVTEGVFTFVAIGEDRKPRALPVI